MDHLFHSLPIGSLILPNRILMAPLTRCRADRNHVPTPLMAEHYAQRSSAGLIIAEATMVMACHSAFQTEPGIYNEAHIKGWRTVTEAVHRKGGRIFLQLWHGGRACHPLINDGIEPISASPFAITNDITHTPQGKANYVIPRELRDDELPGSSRRSPAPPPTPNLRDLMASRSTEPTDICSTSSFVMAATGAPALTVVPSPVGHGFCWRCWPPFARFGAATGWDCGYRPSPVSTPWVKAIR